MAKIPTILEAGRADGKLIKTDSIYDDDQEKFLSDKIKEIDNNHNKLNDTVNSLTNIVNNNELDIENKLEKEQNRATTAENNLRETINNITNINEHAATAELITVNTLPNSTISNVQQALDDLYKNIIYDVSKLNDGIVFESISALLSSPNLSTLIPTSIRCGGMSIRFIQGSVPNSDNKYVQYRLMAHNFTTDVTQWQGVDDEPTAGSDNLVISRGVNNSITDIIGTKFIKGKFLKFTDNQEVVKDADDYSYSEDFIRVRGGDVIHWKYASDNTLNGEASAILYNSNKEAIGYYTMNVVHERDINVPSDGTAYMRFSFHNDNLSTVYVSVNGVVALTYKEEIYVDKTASNINDENRKTFADNIYLFKGKQEVQFSIAANASHSSKIDKINRRSCKGEILSFYVVGTNTNQDTQYHVYGYKADGTSSLLSTISIGSLNIITLTDNFISFGLYVSTQSQQASITFSLIDNIGGDATVINEVTKMLSRLIFRAQVSTASTSLYFYQSNIPIFKKGETRKFSFVNNGTLTNIQHILVYNDVQQLINSNNTFTSVTFTEDVYRLRIYVRIIDFIEAGDIELVIASALDNAVYVDEGDNNFIAEDNLNLVAGSGHSSNSDRIYRFIPAYVPFTIKITGDTATLNDGDNNCQLIVKTVNSDSKSLGYFNSKDTKSFVADENILDYGIYVNGTFITVSGTATVETRCGFPALTPNKDLIGNISVNTFGHDYNAVEISNKLAEFAAHFAADYGNVETFLFFTDPHLFYDTAKVTHGISDADRQEAMSLIQKTFNYSATKYVLCGGDWLTAHKGTEAYTYLSWIDGIMNGYFGDKYFLINGNHDNNYQGKAAFGDEGGDKIPNQTIVDILFKRFGNNKLYYSFLGMNTRWYILDTGTDWQEEMNEYRWEQIEWLAYKLLSDNDAHIAIGMHIIANTGGVNSWINNITPMANYVTQLLEAYNNKTSITLNGVPYNFSSTTGKVYFVLAGHSHYDYNGIVNNIPVIGTTNTKPNYLGHNITFDLVFVDYDNNKLYMTRIGQGSSREIDI